MLLKPRTSFVIAALSFNSRTYKYTKCHHFMVGTIINFLSEHPHHASLNFGKMVHILFLFLLFFFWANEENRYTSNIKATIIKNGHKNWKNKKYLFSSLKVLTARLLAISFVMFFFPFSCQTSIQAGRCTSRIVFSSPLSYFIHILQVNKLSVMTECLQLL